MRKQLAMLCLAIFCLALCVAAAHYHGAEGPQRSCAICQLSFLSFTVENGDIHTCQYWTRSTGPAPSALILPEVSPGRLDARPPPAQACSSGPLRKPSSRLKAATAFPFYSFLCFLPPFMKPHRRGGLPSELSSTTACTRPAEEAQTKKYRNKLPRQIFARPARLCNCAPASRHFISLQEKERRDDRWTIL